VEGGGGEEILPYIRKKCSNIFFLGDPTIPTVSN